MAKSSEQGPGIPASSPCMLHELGPDGAPPDGSECVDPVQARDVANWRKAARERLLRERSAFSEDYRSRQAVEIERALEAILADLPPVSLSLYWPIRGEPDLRAWMGKLAANGVRIALPVAVALGQPLLFAYGSLARGSHAASGRSPIRRTAPNSSRMWSSRLWLGLIRRATDSGMEAASSIGPSRSSLQSPSRSASAIRAPYCRPYFPSLTTFRWIGS